MSTRPGVVTFIGVLMVLQASFTIVGGIVAIALNTQKRIIEETGLSSTELITAGVVGLVIGGLILLVALLLLGGSRVARGLVAAVQIINVMAAAWVMFTHHTGAFLFQGLLSVATAIFVLWALFNERADDYFNAKA